MVSEAMLPRAAVKEVEARLTAAGCPDADFDARELFRLATGRDVRLSDRPLDAAEAEKLFGMNARIILAQGALESGWGTSMLATEHHNFFGLMGYGASNAYWHGQRATFETAYGTHHFRHYEATHLSFLDFARLIRSAYPRAYHFSFQPEAYAKEIAYSPYISEQNGDNRDLYRRNIIALEAEIGKQLELFQWTMNNGQLNHKS